MIFEIKVDFKMRQKFCLLFYPLFNLCARFITKEGFRLMLVTLRGLSRSVWRQLIFEMACLHCEEKGKSF